MRRSFSRSILRHGVSAGIAAGVVSGAPSTFLALLTGRDPLEATAAAGSMVLPRSDSRTRLNVAAIPAHFAIAISWGIVLSASLPRPRRMAHGAAAGLAIGLFDLLVVGTRFERIRTLPLLPQLADHIAFGATVAFFLGDEDEIDAFSPLKPPNEPKTSYPRPIPSGV